MVTCKLAEPNLTYNNEKYKVDQTIVEHLHGSDVWIGYQLAKMPFLFIGCGRSNTGKTYKLTTIGDCFHICDGGTFGIKTNRGEDILSNNTTKECKCVTSPDPYNGTQHGFCDVNDHFALFIPINVNSSEVSTNLRPSGDCLLYYFPIFFWGACERTENIQVMCSIGPYTGSNTTAESFLGNSTSAKNTWSAANSNCLKLNYHPASIESIRNSKFNEIHMRNYWTGIIRSTAIIKSTRADTFTINPVQQFAFLSIGSRVLKFASDDVNKTALCIQGFQTTESSKSSFLTDVVSTTEESISKEFTVGVGIGVAAGILCIVGAVIVVIELIRRGVLPCTFGTPTDEPYASTISFANRSNEETVDDHNYVMIDKRTQSVEYINVQSHTERAYENK
ncbi:hypothetical protein DPMN_078395 [Dreissena polymorpha]|uniref:Uncharacterized protein n=1 Tax=Dreissena polymorpha TaxID=45954 RepID=A0A9D3YQG8_DREPO|nr:hypothetical protein DPMN_078395 [Dreissena polymorpha]